MPADPFDVLGTDQPAGPDALFGISPDAYRNLVNFGMSAVAAANARTPGGFLANPGVRAPLAQGYLGAEQLSAQAGRQRSELAQQQAQTQGLQLQNYMTQLGLPMYQRMMDPAFMQQLMQMATGGGKQPQGQPSTNQ